MKERHYCIISPSFQSQENTMKEKLCAAKLEGIISYHLVAGKVGANIFNFMSR